MNNILVSVIVPAYNIEDYIGRCLESILNQSHKNIEILVIDDGSKDSTWKIINQYALTDSRIIPIHKENGGVSSARLVGIQKSKGEYIGFVDGDDYIEPEMYEHLLKNALKYDADISHCGYQMVFPDHVDYYYNTGILLEQDRKTGLKDLVSGKFIEPGIVNKLYKKKLFKDLMTKKDFIEKVKINEDLLMNYWLFKSSKNSVYEDFCPYHYILRRGSAATADINISKIKDPLDVMKIIREEAKENLEVFYIAEERYINQLIKGSVLKIPRQHIEFIRLRKKIHSELKGSIFCVLKKTYIKRLTKIKAIVVSLCPNGYRWIHNLYAKLRGIDKKYYIE